MYLFVYTISQPTTHWQTQVVGRAGAKKKKIRRSPAAQKCPLDSTWTLNFLDELLVSQKKIFQDVSLGCGKL